jgi:ubiquinol-cytochrome c reductase cytochrome b subunit
MFGKTIASIRAWAGERYPVAVIEDLIHHQAVKPLPAHVGYLHTTGSLALFLLANQIVTGILLMVYYRPTADTAFESAKFIMTQAQLGWFIRGLHAWGANLMIATVLIHAARTFIMGAFKKPRELTWVVGASLLIAVLSFGFTGYLLPWNQLSYWATTVGTEVAGAVPGFGHFVKVLLRGGEAVSEETISRFYVVHVIVLPWVIVGLVTLHLFFMRLQGLAPLRPVGEGEEIPEGTGIPFFPNHVLKELTLFPWFILGLITIVILFPIGLGDKANPLVTPEGIKPEWYFLPAYQLLKYFPKLLGIFASSIPLILLFLWPFLDRGPQRQPARRPLSTAIGAAAILLALALGVVGHLSESDVTWRGQTYHLDPYGLPHRAPNPAVNK